MKYIYSLALFVLLALNIDAQTNLSLLGQLTYNVDMSDIWGYAANGREYALVGTETGVAIVDVTVPANPDQLFYFNGPTTFWRDLKEHNGYCYVTNESSGGLLIIDLNHLPDSVGSVNWTGGSLGLQSAHNIFIDENGIGYIVGANNSAGDGAIFIDLNSNPMNPTVLDQYTQRYVHDLFVRGDTMWTAEIDNGIFSVVDVSNKSNPVVMATRSTPSNFTHNLWLSDDGNTLLTTDEVSGAVIAAYDVSDLSNITELDRYQSNPGTNVIPHNVFYINDFAVISYYRDGIIILDASQPKSLVEVGDYDTSPLSGQGFNGCWGVYPYLPSGNIIATDIEEGFMVFSVNYQRASFLKGTVTESGTNNPLNNVTVEIVGTSSSESTNIIGAYQIGILDAGTYTVTFSKAGYITHTENNVNVQAGNVTTLNVQLIPSETINLSGLVLDEESGLGIPNATVVIENNDQSFSVVTGASGNFTINTFETGYYDGFAGKWGHRTKQESLAILSSGSPVVFALDSGYYDDFVLNFGWSITGNASTGIWERGIPIGTVYDLEDSNPNNDVVGDIGTKCYVTGNSGGSAGDDDVDDGTTVLTSPIFDLSAYQDPYLSYYRWFFNDGGNSAPNDALSIELSNGLTTVTIETITANSPNSNSWNENEIRVSDYLTPTANMRISFETSDLPTSGHLVEAGLDWFEVNDSISIQPPQVNFSASDTAKCIGEVITFTDLSSNTPNTWLWEFGNGDTSTDQDPTYSYSNTGTFNVTLTASNDGGSNSVTVNSLITIKPAPDFSVAGQDVLCHGEASGQATVQVNSGLVPYDYSWSTNDQSASVNGLPSGNYEVTVEDGNNCSATESVTINEPAAITTSENIVDATCGNNNGIISLSVSGGTGAFAYVWQTGDTLNILDSVASGNYSVTISDESNCTVVGNYSVSNIDGPVVTPSTTSVTCPGGNDGDAQLSITGGTLPYNIAWSHGPSSQNLFGLTAGTYGVTISDSNNCQSIKNVTINEPDDIIATFDIQDATCGSSNGALSFNQITGGTLPYFYSWSTGSPLASVNGLIAGSYSVTITDSEGCAAVAATTVENLEGPQQIDFDVSTPSCNQSNDAAIEALPIGGTAPYSFTWSDGSNQSTISGLDDGSYSITVRDANFCSVTASTTIQSPDPISLSATTVSESDAGTQDGQATVSITGGTAPYQITWSNGNTGEALSNVGKGSYLVTVHDANGCSQSMLVNIGNITSIKPINELNNIIVFPNPFKDEFVISSELPIDKVSIYNAFGQLINGQKEINLNEITLGNDLSPGVYFLLIKSSNGNMNSAKIIKSR